MDNRHGLAVDASLSLATGDAERTVALTLTDRIGGARRLNVGADKGYDVRSFVQGLRVMNITPHIAAKRAGHSALDGRTTRHPGYVISQRARKRVEEIFGWMKTVGLMRKTRHRGVNRVGWMVTFTAAVYNLVRIKNLEMETG